MRSLNPRVHSPLSCPVAASAPPGLSVPDPLCLPVADIPSASASVAPAAPPRSYCPDRCAAPHSSAPSRPQCFRRAHSFRPGQRVLAPLALASPRPFAQFLCPPVPPSPPAHSPQGPPAACLRQLPCPPLQPIFPLAWNRPSVLVLPLCLRTPPVLRWQPVEIAPQLQTQAQGGGQTSGASPPPASFPVNLQFS